MINEILSQIADILSIRSYEIVSAISAKILETESVKEWQSDKTVKVANLYIFLTYFQNF